ncbi:MAG: PKD domain-containing protein [Gemmatimonadaceae bacterium]
MRGRVLSRTAVVGLRSAGLTLVALIAFAGCRDDTVVEPKLNAPSTGPERELRIASGLVAVDLGTPGGSSYSEAKSINDSRQIVGISIDGAWLWQNGTMTSLGNSGLNEARGISDNGAIVGAECDLAACRAALLNGPTLTVLGTLGGAQSIAFGVNAALQVIGWSETQQPPNHGFVWQNGTLSDLGGLTANHWTVAYGINSSGQIVGTSAEVFGCVHNQCSLSQTRPFIWQNGVMARLEGYSGTAYATNDGGVVAGESADSAVLHVQATIWQNGVRTLLGVLPGDSASRALAINNAGQVVGVSSVSFISGGLGRAFLWENGVMTALPSLGGANSNALGINAGGDVVGWSNTANGDTHAVLWTDTPPNRPPNASAGGPYSGDEGTAIAFDASGSTDPDGQPLTYDWDFGDGSPHGSGPTPLHTYVDNGTYSVTLTVSDGTLSATASATATVANAAPVPNAGADKTIVVNRSSPFTPTFTDAGSADANWTYTVRWGDGTSITRTATSQGTQASLSHAYNTAGTFTRRLTVTDKDGGTAFDEATITVVPNQAPTASINGPYAGNEGTTVVFSSAGTSDPNGDLLTYTWRFGDGGTSAVANPSKSYSDNGTYTVTLTVRDPSGATATATTTATIANVAPTAVFVAPTTVTEGTPATIALNAGTDKGAADRSTLEYAFDCGQGAGLSPWSSSIKSIICPAHPDQRPPVTVIGQIRDKDGGLTAYQRTMSVTNAAPAAVLTATTATTFPVSGALTVQGSFTDKGMNDQPWTYTITWGDGTASTAGSVTMPGSLPAASHVYTRAGTFAVRLNVKDKDAKIGTSATIMVTVTP